MSGPTAFFRRTKRPSASIEFLEGGSELRPRGSFHLARVMLGEKEIIRMGTIHSNLEGLKIGPLADRENGQLVYALLSLQTKVAKEVEIAKSILSPKEIRKLKKKKVGGYLAFTRNGALIRFFKRNNFQEIKSDEGLNRWAAVFDKISRSNARKDPTWRRIRYLSNPVHVFFYDFSQIK